MSLWGAGSGLNAITGLKKDILLVLVPRTTICLQPVTTALWMLIWIWLIWIADRWCRPCRRDCTWIVCRVPTFRWPTSNRPGDDGRALIGHHWANDSARDCRRSKFRCPKCRPSEAGADGADASRYETSDYPPLRRNLFFFFFFESPEGWTARNHLLCRQSERHADAARADPYAHSAHAGAIRTRR